MQFLSIFAIFPFFPWAGDIESKLPGRLDDIGFIPGITDFWFVKTMLAISQPDLLILKLIEKLKDTDPRTRRNAAGALRLHGPRAVSAIPALADLLQDQDSRVRYEAERAIDQLRQIAA
jgi:hypothetical protein